MHRKRNGWNLEPHGRWTINERDGSGVTYRFLAGDFLYQGVEEHRQMCGEGKFWKWSLRMIWASTWLLGGDTGCSCLVGTVHWVNIQEAQGLAYSKCPINRSPYSHWEWPTYTESVQPQLLRRSLGRSGEMRGEGLVPEDHLRLRDG